MLVAWPVYARLRRALCGANGRAQCNAPSFGGGMNSKQMPNALRGLCNRPTAAALLAGAAAAKSVTLGLALRSRRDGWEGSRYRAPTAVEQGREGADRRRDADVGSGGERGRPTARRGAEPALHMAKAGSHRGSHERRLDFASR